MDVTEFFVTPTNFAICESLSILCCLINHKAESGLSCLLDRGIYFLVFFSVLDISISILLIWRALFSSLDDNSISSLDNCPEIIGL